MKKNINTIMKDFLMTGDPAKEKEIKDRLPEEESFQEIMDSDDFAQRMEEYLHTDKKEAYEEMRDRLHHAGLLEQRLTVIQHIKPYLRYAAVILAIITCGGIWWYADYTKVTPPVLSQEVEQAMHQSMMSGKQEAKVEKLDELAVNDKNPVAAIQEELEQYDIDDDVVEELLAAKRVTTLHDKEFWVTLDDKTVVHLNYNSKLIYPEKFQGGSRDVILEGEAYFMVAHDKSRQFVVHTPQGDVAVHGTEFMVNTRKNENNKNNHDLSVVLVNGSIGFTPNNGKEVMMAPGQELSVVNNELSIHIVDTAIFTAWNTGTFMFEEEPLSSLMEVVSRWYGYKVIFADKAAESITITGNIDKYRSAEPFLETLERITQLNVSVNGKTVIIRSK